MSVELDKFPAPIGEFPLTGIPIASGDIFYHNWLYSVVPVAVRTEDWPYNGTNAGPTISYPLLAYLTGYCKNCNQAFSQQIPTGGSYNQVQMDIPKEGCVAPR